MKTAFLSALVVAALALARGHDNSSRLDNEALKLRKLEAKIVILEVMAEDHERRIRALETEVLKIKGWLPRPVATR